MMMHRNEEKRFFSVRRVLTRAIIGIAALFLVSGTPISTAVVPPAQAQFRGAQFHDALAPYGQWRHSSRWGDVWAPQVNPDWRPYTVGRSIYTDDWGWYWVAGDSEGQWGWVVYHYGRWVFDADLGWIWIPDDTWGPAWVMWRPGNGAAWLGAATARAAACRIPRGARRLELRASTRILRAGYRARSATGKPNHRRLSKHGSGEPVTAGEWRVRGQSRH